MDMQAQHLSFTLSMRAVPLRFASSFDTAIARTDVAGMVAVVPPSGAEGT